MNMRSIAVELRDYLVRARASVDEEIRTLVMRGYETARQIIERQRPAVKALAEELLEVESVDADRLRDILAAAVVPASTSPAAVRDALMQAQLGS